LKLEGTYTFDAPPEVVWPALLDPEVLGRVMPGGEALEKIGENEYKAVLKIRVGPVQGQFEGLVTLLDKFTGELSHAGERQGCARFYEG